MGGGWQKLSYLPEANTDFVFAVIGEELGLLGTLTVCVLWIFVYLCGRRVLKSEAEDSFRWVLGTTLLSQLVLQAMANIAVVTALIGLILGPGSPAQSSARLTVSQTDN